MEVSEMNTENVESKFKKRKRKKKPGRTRNSIKTKDAEQKENIENSENKENMPEIEYIEKIPSIDDLEPMYRQYARVFEAFKLSESSPKDAADKDEATGQNPPATGIAITKNILGNTPLLDIFDEVTQEQQDTDTPRLSKRKLKKLERLSMMELKHLVERPNLVEMHDVNARDPKLLVDLKSYRNTVPVPRHWCFKRKYLQGKRGIEKPPFELPDFIKRTGITEMRAGLQEREDTRTLKAKMRERARPKLGKVDIDYQKLHDAFFKWQTKPRMTIHGDLYYEGKEFETRLNEKKPGELSDELRTALGMPVGPSCEKVPPPWLIAMQRYGPPPSYPELKVPGVNAPIPEGCTFGYHLGGWGKPPINQTGQPIYGDVFGISRIFHMVNAADEEIGCNMWGELEPELSSDEEEVEDGKESDETGEDENIDSDGLVTPDASGLVTPDAGGLIPNDIASIPAGLETPETIELRKKKIESEMEDNDGPVLYTVLEERRTESLGASMMGSAHVYDMTGAAGGQAPPSVAAPLSGNINTDNVSDAARAEKDGIVELTLDPSELDLDSETMASRYEETIRSRQTHLKKEDLSDMVRDHVQRQKNKRKHQEIQDMKTSKKHKEFKF